MVRKPELVAGSVGESMFLGSAWNAADDRAQEVSLASLICSSPEAVAASSRRLPTLQRSGWVARAFTSHFSGGG
jgi:hypothetical protein